MNDSRSIIVNVLFFARGKQLAGTERVQLRLPSESTVADARVQLVDQFPALAEILPHCNIAINCEYTVDSDPLFDGCELGCIPPVSGG